MKLPASFLSLLLLPAVLLAPPAAANHTCLTAFSLAHNGGATGAVGDAAVGWSPSHWYSHFGTGADAYVLVAGAQANTGHVQTSEATARLRIWDSTCTLLLCDVFADNDTPGACLFGGNARIEVRYGFSHEFHTDYTLRVVN